MNKKIIIPTVLFIGVLIFSFFVFGQTKGGNQLEMNDPIAQENQEADSLPSINDGLKDKEEEKIEQTSIVLFYGDGCPHCEIVDDYVVEGNVEAKVPFVKKEVYYNRQNAEELVTRAQACGLSTDSIGVPFLWDGEKCLIGDQDIINFFKQKINKQ